MKKEFDILKKTYLPPRVEFEEIEIDEMEMLMAGSVNDGGGGDFEGGEGDSGNPSNPGGRPKTNSLDVDFDLVGVSSTSDFVIND